MRDGGVTVGSALIGPARDRSTPSASAATRPVDIAPAVAPAATPRKAVASGWRRAILGLAVGFAALVAIYQGTVLNLFTSWSGSRTFTHGWFIYPISLWLVWRLRSELAPIAPKVQPLALLPLVACGLAWLVGHAAGVHAAEQYAFVAMTQCLVWAVFGNAVTRRIAFPLAFLFLAVPIGDFLTPTLIDHTANFTVEALRLSGVPVYREGNYFQIPSGNWSVVEACSGINYLVASITLGVLFAYLNYRSAWRRTGFIVASILVPIVANWLRAYLIVMLAHVSGNALATGVDHVVYGWLFFGLVMLLLFWIGNFWRDDDVAPGDASVGPAVAPEPRGLQRAWPLVFITVAFVVIAAPWPALGNRVEARTDAARPEAVTIDPIAGWTADGNAFTSFRPHYLRARSSVATDYVSGDRKVQLFVAYYSGQAGNGSLLTYDNDVVVVSDQQWGLVEQRRRETASTDGPLAVIESDLRGETRAGSEHLTSWHWYWINGRPTTSREVAKVYTAFDKLLGRGDDSAVIVVSTPAATDARAALADFVRAAEPAIATSLARIHDGARR